MIQMRLIRNMKITNIPQAHIRQIRRQLRQKGLQKRLILRAQRQIVPAKDLTVLSIDSSHDLGTGLRAPLREQVGNFKINDTMLLTETDPACQLGKIKGIRAVCQRNIHQLQRCAFAADLRIQRQGKDGGEDHILAALRRQTDMVFHNFPVLFTEDRQLVVVSQTITMEPAGIF